MPHIVSPGLFRSPTAIVVTVFALLVSSCSGDDDSDRSVLDLEARGKGTCLDFEGEVGELVKELPVMDCNVQHSHEIFAVVVSTATVYPGFEALEIEAQAKCLGEFEGYIGRSAFDSELFYSWMVPTLTSWDREKDREIICVVGESNGAPLFRSVEGENR
jgi:hypothetical protein